MAGPLYPLSDGHDGDLKLTNSDLVELPAEQPKDRKRSRSDVYDDTVCPDWDLYHHAFARAASCNRSDRWHRLCVWQNEFIVDKNPAHFYRISPIS